MRKWLHNYSDVMACADLWTNLTSIIVRIFWSNHEENNHRAPAPRLPGPL